MSAVEDKDDRSFALFIQIRPSHQEGVNAFEQMTAVDIVQLVSTKQFNQFFKIEMTATTFGNHLRLNETNSIQLNDHEENQTHCYAQVKKILTLLLLLQVTQLPNLSKY